jgi:hypothetical protein
VTAIDKIAEPVINCPTFQELILKHSTDRINKAIDGQDRTRLAKELQKEVNVLLSCPTYDSETFDCKRCHCIANLRRKTAAVFIRAQNSMR